MDRDAIIYENVLDNMHGGVITVDLDGRILTFNAGASRILGIARDGALNAVFAEVFVPLEGMDAFVQAVMDAVYEAQVGRQRVVEIQSGGKTLSLALTTSYLQDVRDAETRKIGVVVLFSDITELKELRESELRLAETAKAQHAELQEAYRTIEANNQALIAATKRERVAAVCVVALFLAAGLYASRESAPPPDATPAGFGRSASGDMQTVVVTPQRLTATISVPGQLAPRREVQVISPITGKVAAIHFQYGARVTKGQRLVDLDTTEIEERYRRAQSTYIKALLRFNELDDWENSVEVVRARRTISKTRLQLEAQQNKRDETAFLLEKGVIPTSEHEAAEQQLHNLRLDYEAVQQDLKAVLAKGGADEKQIARLELDTARVQLRTAEETLERAVVTAPVTGVVLQLNGEGTGQSEQGAERLATGRSVTQGAGLLTIGDLEGLSVTGKVDEVDIARVRPGQPVNIRGDAFPGLELTGTIVHVSSQAAQHGPGGARTPTFEIRAAIDNLTAAQRRQLRLGMSASLDVVVYDRPDALLVPLRAVQRRNGKTWLHVRDTDTGGVEEIEVGAGVTTVDAVEIVRGLEAGDEVVLAGV